MQQINNKKNNTHVLIDLKIATNHGYCGIAKENCLLFNMLAQLPHVDAEGFLISDNVATIFSRYKQLSSRIDELAQTNEFFHDAFHHQLSFKQKILLKLKLQYLYLFKKNKFDLFAIDDVYHDTIWRNTFSRTLTAEHKHNIFHDKNKFYYSDLTTQHLRAAAYLNKSVSLNTEGKEFAIFLEPTAVRVSPHTKKIVRYHDAIPITDPDFVDGMFAKSRIHVLNQCAKDSYFVCNSDATLNILLNLKPELAEKAFVIPIALTNHYQKKNDVSVLKKIILTRMSHAIVADNHLTHVRDEIEHAEHINYMFNLAALDPKKNHVQLIRAFEKILYQSSGKIKLLLAANKGWFSTEIEHLLRPHIERGNIIHLENIATEELPYLFSHAALFIFPSYTEGFGLPPLEALQCECPTIVSDIPAHRYVLGDAALYCDPYDVDALVDRINQLLFADGRETLRHELKQKGLMQIEKYDEALLMQQWVSLLEKLKE